EGQARAGQVADRLRAAANRCYVMGGGGGGGEDVVGLLVIIMGLALFFAAHVFTTKREARAQAIARLGEGTYKILYSLASLAGLALIIWGFAHYRATGWIDVWYPPKVM